MDLHDYVELIALGLWVACIVGIGILSRLHFKNKKLEQFRLTANDLMKKYISFYEQENLSEEKKINRIANAVVDGLQAKGFKVTEQDVEDILAGVEKVIKERDLTEQEEKKD
ncbi:hypothetical protein J2Z60_002131 [Lactobacillus colini]|uniref:Helveticin n=1 Tax=Lactobacillus colini TaxID=1819254 RepID=A0ABS4MGW9_9LACO|nr:helveticin [Lactobacillus colini]MBP2058940.1 hypothetical protein [Lactobacillus colini]